MKSPGSVYRKLKEIKYKYLVVLYKKYLKKTPENCGYHHVYEFRGVDNKMHKLPVCLLHQTNKEKLDLQLVDVCTDTQHSINCNAFVSKYTKDDIKSIMEKELSVRSTRERLYPEICALEWVLERSSVVEGFPPLDLIQRIYLVFKRILFGNKIL